MTLSEQDLELLTAFVDGEMTSRQRKAALRLLNESSEARSILGDLQENAHRLKALPPHKLDPQFVSDVMAGVERQGTRKSVRARVVRRLPRWVKFSAAAACLLLIVGGTYFATRNGDHNSSGIDEKGSVRLAFAEVGSEGKQQLLARKLSTGNAVNLSFRVKNNSQAVNRLTDALEGAGVRTVIDPRARTQLKKEQGVVQYVVYAENLKPGEVQGLLRQLASEELKTPRKRTFESLEVSDVSREDRHMLSGLLGMDPLDNQTAKLEEKKLFDAFPIDAAKDKTGEPASMYTPPERFAVILTNTGGEGGLSPEIKSFLAQRKAQRPGTVQVLMVISSV
ncbi:MAG: hypothetical protein HY040_06310 [Planctomycetes bacterium]|nr:hypothetical protein [Planctomycetota bacterium]